MAVEIPVVVDIEGAFQDAAGRIGSAIRPLQREVDAETLKLNITVGVDEEGNTLTKTFGEIRSAGVKDMSILRTAIDSVTQSLIEVSKTGEKANFANLLEAKVYMEDMMRAASRSKLEIDGLANTMSGLSARIQSAKMALENTNINSPEFAKVAQAFREISAEQDAVMRKLQDMGNKYRSIDDLNFKLSEIQRKWAAMKEGDMFKADGTMTAGAKKLADDYTKISLELEKRNKLLADGVQRAHEAEQAEKRRLEEEEKRIMKELEEEDKRNAAARKHREELAMTARSMDDLNTKLRAWQQEMNSADIGSDQWREAARWVSSLAERIKTVSLEISKIGIDSKSGIGRLRAQVQAINAEWERMSYYEKFVNSDQKELTPEARRLYETYKACVDALQKQGQTLDQLLQKEQRIADAVKKGAKQRQYENAILSTSVKTMRVLQEQERILSDRLSRSIIGSDKYTRLKEQLEAVRREMKEINGEPMRDVAAGAEAANSKIKNLLVNAVRLYALHAATRFVKNIREVTSEFELQRVALGSIIQDTERAEQMFRQIKAAAIQSPFEIKDLVTYTKQLSAYQIETEKLFDTTMKLADVSAGLGVDMGRLILAYGQVRAASVLRGQELRQFTEAGIPLVEKLAEKFTKLRGETVKTGEVFQLISERAVPFKMIAEIFDEMTSAGGVFYRMQEKQAKTLAGQWANLKDALSIMYDEIGRTDAVHGAMESLIGGARELFLNWRKWADMIKIVGSSLLVYIGYQKASALATAAMAKIEAAAIAAESAREKGMKRLVTSIMGKTVAEKISTKATHLASAATFKAAAASTALERAFWRLTMALLANPFSAVALAVSGLVALFVTLGNKTRDIEKDIDNLKSSVIALGKTTGPDSLGAMIDSYEELSKKQSRTAEEQKKLKDLSIELSKAFPKATEKINEQTGAFDLNIAKLRAYNEEAEKALRKGTQAQIDVDEKELKRNKKEIDRLNTEINTGWGRNKALTLLSPIKVPLSKERIAEINAEVEKLTAKNIELNQAIQEAKDALNGVKKEGEESVEEITAWQTKLIDFNSEIKDGKAIQVISPDQIKGYSRLEDALDDVAKAYKTQEERVDILTKALEGKNGEEEKELRLALALATARRDLAKSILDYYNAFNLTQKKTKASRHEQDPFIEQLKDRMKFMQDFKKGYEDLKKYLGAEAALERESGIMVNRGLALGLDATEQKRAAKDLSGWYTDAMNKAFAQAKKRGAKGTLDNFLSQEIKGSSDQSKTLREFQNLIQSLWDAKTDLDTSEMKKNFEDALARLADGIKRSEVARDFFNDILDLTGNKDLAADLTMTVYGETGSDLEKKLKEQLSNAFTLDDEKLKSQGVSVAQAHAEVARAIMENDYVALSDYLEYVTDKSKDTAKELLLDRMKTNADWLKDFQKTYSKSKTFQERIDIENAKRDQKLKEAREHNASQSELDAINRYYDEQVSSIELEALKDTYEWTQAFKDLERVSTSTLESLLHLLDEYIEKSKGKISPEALKAMTESRDKVQEQLVSRNAYSKSIDSLRRYALAKKKANVLDKEGKKNTLEYKKAQDEASDALKDAKDSVTAINSSFETLSSIVSSVSDLLDLDELSDGRAVLEGIAKGLGLVGTALVFINAIFTLLETNPIVLAISGIIAGVAALASIMSNLRVARANREIEKQSELIEDLEYQYSRLETAIAKSFGSDYITNYNQQLDNLLAKQEAYMKQAEAERSKGKKADQDKIKEYENSAREVGDQLTEMQTQLSEFFTDTDLTSAAKDFANAWIEAYKEFGSTTDAMKERFQDMIQNMVEKSLAAKIMQELLQPIFDQIDILAKEGGELSVEDISAIARMANTALPNINDAMGTLMNTLAAAGYNIRQHPGQFSGISRNIANATEESISGLAAGINTQNYYMQYMPIISANVATIVSYLTGGSVEVSGATPITPTNSELTMKYLSALPTMDENLALLLSLVRSMVVPRSASPNSAQNFLVAKVV